MADYDVIVIGGGAAGMSAAITAHDRGARVLLLESETKLGGSTALSGGWFFAAGTSVQRAAGIVDDSPQVMFDYYAQVSVRTASCCAAGTRPPARNTPLCRGGFAR